MDDDFSGIPTNPSPPTAISALDALAPGQLVAGRYEILERIGVGGMGAVFRVHDRELGEDIALKVLLPERLADPGMLERFRREVKLTRRITHPNVCRVFDLGEDGGLRFLTMELIEGHSLRALLAEGPLPPGHALEILARIIDGVGAAHAQGIIHRDLKPENVLYGHDGRVVVVDFGLARSPLGNRSTLTAFAGTPAYMSPEQLRGESLDLRSDVFSLGIVAYEMLAGRSPFGEGAPATVVSAILRDPPHPLEIPTLPDGMQHALSDVLRRALEKRPEDRFASARGLGEALAAVAARADTTSEPKTSPLNHVRTSRETDPSQCETTNETQREVETPKEASRTPRSWTNPVLIGFLGFVFLAAWDLAWRHLYPRRESPSSPTGSALVDAPSMEFDDNPAVAVLAFDNLSGDNTWDPLSQGAAEAIRAELRTMSDIVLVDAIAEQDMAAKGVVWLVGGSVQRVGEKLRLTAQFRPLGEAAMGEPIEVDGEPGEPAKLLERLRRRAQGEARLLWQLEDQRRWVIRGTEDKTARQKLLQYHVMVGPKPQREHFEIGKRLLDEALDADPEYVPALVERAYLRSLGAGGGTTEERMKAARDDIDRAITIAPVDKHALVMRCRVKQITVELVGYPSDRALDAAVEACGAALAADPASPYVRRSFARIHDRRCEDDQAMATLERLFDFDRIAPTDTIRHFAGLALQNDRLLVAERMSLLLVDVHEEEKQFGARALSRRAGSAPLRAAHLFRAAVLMKLGRQEEAWDELMKELEGASSGLSESWTEAAAIRGLLRLAPQIHKGVPAPLLQRLEVLEAEFKSTMLKNPLIARTVANAYNLTDPKAALSWLDALGTPRTCDEAIGRTLYYHNAGDDEGARRALTACAPKEEWEKSCVAHLETRLGR